MPPHYSFSCTRFFLLLLSFSFLPINSPLQTTNSRSRFTFIPHTHYLLSLLSTLFILSLSSRSNSPFLLPFLTILESTAVSPPPCPLIHSKLSSLSSLLQLLPFLHLHNHQHRTEPRKQMLVNTTTFLASQVRNSLSATVQSTNAIYISLKSTLGLATSSSSSTDHSQVLSDVDQHQHGQQQRSQSQSRHAQYPSLQSPWRGLLENRIKQNYEYTMPVVSSCYSAPRHPIVLCHGKQQAATCNPYIKRNEKRVLSHQVVWNLTLLSVCLGFISLSPCYFMRA